PDSLAERLQALRHKRKLTKVDVEEILTACLDTRLLSAIQRKQDESKNVDRTHSPLQLAWSLLKQPFSFEDDAFAILFQALDNDNVLEVTVCAAAAKLLQHSQTLPNEVREKSIQKILRILQDEEISNREWHPIDLGHQKLYDVLFDALKALSGTMS